MTPNAPIRLPRRRDAAVLRVAEDWRRLTGDLADDDRRTLVACSGGVDSSALALVLRSINDARDNLVLAHIVHDLRTEAETLADRNHAHELAGRLGVPFVEGVAHARAQPGNTEANARRARYTALTALARKEACPFVATGHHADDQLESLIMALVRGAGPAGMRGVAPRRWLDRDHGVRLIRPMLGVSRQACERLCHEAGWMWREDRTNRDLDRLRSAVRSEITPALRALRPGVAERATATARVMRQTVAGLRAIARGLDERASVTPSRAGERAWARSPLREAPPAVVGELIRSALRAAQPACGEDAMGERATRRIVRAARDGSGERRRFDLGRREIVVEADVVRLGAAASPQE